MGTMDLRQELSIRIESAQSEIEKLKKERGRIEDRLLDVEIELAAWREAYKLESERLGEPGLPLFKKGDKSYRFVGKRLVDIVATLRKENQEITKQGIRRILEEDGYDFKGKNPGQAIHFAWLAFGRRKPKG